MGIVILQVLTGLKDHRIRPEGWRIDKEECHPAHQSGLMRQHDKNGDGVLDSNELVLMTLLDFCDFKKDNAQSIAVGGWTPLAANALCQLGLDCTKTGRKDVRPSVEQCIERLEQLMQLSAPDAAPAVQVPALSRAGKLTI